MLTEVFYLHEKGSLADGKTFVPIYSMILIRLRLRNVR